MGPIANDKEKKGRGEAVSRDPRGGAKFYQCFILYFNLFPHVAWNKKYFLTVLCFTKMDDHQVILATVTSPHIHAKIRALGSLPAP